MRQTLVRSFAGELSDEILNQVIADHEQLEKDGSIGNCTLRDVTAEMRKALDIPDNGFVTLWMRELYIAAIETMLARAIIERDYWVACHYSGNIEW